MQYEFTFLTHPTQDKLNDLGKSGWRVASAAWGPAGEILNVLLEREIPLQERLTARIEQDAYLKAAGN